MWRVWRPCCTGESAGSGYLRFHTLQVLHTLQALQTVQCKRAQTLQMLRTVHTVQMCAHVADTTDALCISGPCSLCILVAFSLML